MHILTYKQFENSVWVDSFLNQTKFKFGSKFYKLIENKLNTYINNFPDAEDRLNGEGFPDFPKKNYDNVIKVIFILEYNNKGKTKTAFGFSYESGHNIYNNLIKELEREILNDPDVTKYTQIKETMKDKIEHDLSRKIFNTTKEIMFKIVKDELDEKLYSKYQKYLDNPFWEESLPNWVIRSKKANLWNNEIR